MKIDAHTTQADLERLYRAISQREMLRSTPLNLKMFLRYAVLFLLFPGMAAGFWVGMGLTLLFAVGMVVLLALELTPEAELAMRVWLGAGGLVLVWVSWGTTRAALAQRRRQLASRPAESPAGGTPLALDTYKIKWRPSDDKQTWEAEWHICAPASGTYALLLDVQGMGKRRLITRGRRGVCCVQSRAGLESCQSLLLFRLDAGEHRVGWSLVPAAGPAPQARITLLCMPPVAASSSARPQ